MRSQCRRWGGGSRTFPPDGLVLYHKCATGILTDDTPREEATEMRQLDGSAAPPIFHPHASSIINRGCSVTAGGGGWLESCRWDSLEVGPIAHYPWRRLRVNVGRDSEMQIDESLQRVNAS